jgi:hypothetical protein
LDVKSKTNLNLLKDAYSKSKNQTFKLKKQASCKFIGIVTATKKSNPRVVSSSLTWGQCFGIPGSSVGRAAGQKYAIPHF